MKRNTCFLIALIYAINNQPDPLFAQSNEEVPVTGLTSNETNAVDQEIIKYIEKHNVPGMSVAMTVNGKLKYARGFGYADVNSKQPVKPESLFRIASLSKPITAVAILQLVEKQKVSLEDRVLEILTEFDHEIEAAGGKFDERFRHVTIRQLLQHRGGWDRNASFDPMFQSVRFANQLGIAAPATSRQVISAMMSHPLDYDPGQKYAYSNFGYNLLGRVIEKVSGIKYEKFVQREILQPLGIKSMRIGKTLGKERQDLEVHYYHKEPAKSVFKENLGQKVPSPYGGWYLEAMDSHGGWIASAVDLARFASAFDRPNQCPILSRESIQMMFDRPHQKHTLDANESQKPVYYALGWSVRDLDNEKTNQWHTGSLPGTTAIMIRRHDGKNFIALVNTRETPSSDSISGDLDRLLHRAANKINNWGEHNYFNHTGYK